MSEAYQYALWRVVPDAERGERVNVGVVVYSPRLRFLGARTHVDADRLRELFPGVDLVAVETALAKRAAIAAGEPAAGPIAAMSPSDRFGFLVAPASTVVRPGAVHTGLCDDAAAALEHLFARLVLPPD
jgi:hypothetical protein